MGVQLVNDGFRWSEWKTKMSSQVVVHNPGAQCGPVHSDHVSDEVFQIT